MKSISAAKRSSVVSLLNEGYSHHQVQARTGLGKGTIGRISQEVVGDKENHPGCCPSKLSPCDKQSIIRQISSGRLDNAVQATRFINSTITTPITPQTVRNVLKEAGLRSATKKIEFAQYHENWTVEDWKRVLWTDETKVNRIGSDGKVYVWKKQGEAISDWTTTPTVKHGGGNNLMVWGCMGWNGVGKLVEVQGKMDADELWERVAEEWTEIPPETCQRLIESMPRRIQAVLKAKGGHTKY
jgi:transposase